MGVAEAPTSLEDFDLVVVGGPTHAMGHVMAFDPPEHPLRVDKPHSDLVLEPGAATGPGVREWLQSVSRSNTKAAAFDTRLNSPALFTGTGLQAHRSRAQAPRSLDDRRPRELLGGQEEPSRPW